MKNTTDLIPISTIDGKRYALSHSWAKFTSGAGAKHVECADEKDPQITHFVHVSRIAGLWPQSRNKAARMKREMLRELATV